MNHLTKEEATKFFSELFYGEHHLPSEIEVCGFGWKVKTHRSLATTDFNELTRFVLLCHELCIRGEISHNGVHGLIIMIWKREREGGISESHPTIETAIENFRDYRIKKGFAKELLSV